MDWFLYDSNLPHERVNNQPDKVIVHVGTNDIISNNAGDAEVANEMLKITKRSLYIINSCKEEFKVDYHYASSERRT